MPAIDIFQRHPAAAPGAAPAAPKRTLPQRAGTRQSHCTLQRHQHSKVPKHALYRRRPPAEAPCSSTLQSNCTLQWRQHSGSEERATTDIVHRSAAAALCAPPPRLQSVRCTLQLHQSANCTAAPAPRLQSAHCNRHLGVASAAEPVPRLQSANIGNSSYYT